MTANCRFDRYLTLSTFGVRRFHFCKTYQSNEIQLSHLEMHGIETCLTITPAPKISRCRSVARFREAVSQNPFLENRVINRLVNTVVLCVQ